MENLTVKNQKYSCFTKEQQAQFDALTIKQKKYVIFRGQNYSKVDAAVMAGYKKTKYIGQTSYKMETKEHPEMYGLIEALGGHQKRINIYKEGTPESNFIDEKAEQLPIEAAITASTAKKEDPLPDLSQCSVEDAKRIQFFRQIQDGTIKSKKITKTYDKDGKLTGTKVEETSDIDTRIKARKELDRILGLNDMLAIGKVEAGNINIMIVDASKQEIGDNDKLNIDSKNLKEIDGEISIVEEVKEVK